MSTLLLAALLAPPAAPDRPTAPAAPAVADPLAALTEGATPLNRQGTVLLDSARKRVAVRGEVCLRGGALEMLMCLDGTKTHESVLKYEGDARTLHAGLVAVGLEPGSPVSFEPTFTPPRGPVVKITLYWADETGAVQTAAGADWVRTSTDRWYERNLAALPAGATLPEDLELRYDATSAELLWYGRMSAADRDRAVALSPDPAFRKAVRSMFEESQPKPLTADFVFAGSYMYDRPTVYNERGEVEETVRAYAAEDGDVVCVANFPTATIDIAERSSADDGSVVYEAATEKIPPKGTPVVVTFEAGRPDPPAPDPADEEEDAAPAAGS